jgi:hypothetical protein
MSTLVRKREPSTQPQVGAVYLLPSRRRVRVLAAHGDAYLACRYVNAAGHELPLQQGVPGEGLAAGVTLSRTFLVRHCERVPL